MSPTVVELMAVGGFGGGELADLLLLKRDRSLSADVFFSVFRLFRSVKAPCSSRVPGEFSEIKVSFLGGGTRPRASTLRTRSSVSSRGSSQPPSHPPSSFFLGMDFKGARVIIIDSSPDFIRGIHGLDELLKTPFFVRPSPPPFSFPFPSFPPTSSACPASSSQSSYHLPERPPAAADSSLAFFNLILQEMPARVGRRKTQPDESKMDVDAAGPSSSKKAKVSSYLVGKDLEDALAAGEELEVTWPMRGKDAWSDWRSIEALW